MDWHILTYRKSFKYIESIAMELLWFSVLVVFHYETINQLRNKSIIIAIVTVDVTLVFIMTLVQVMLVRTRSPFYRRAVFKGLGNYIDKTFARSLHLDSGNVASLYWISLQTAYVQGLYSLSGKTSYRKISWSLEATRFGFKPFQLLWNLAGTSAALLPRCLSNFRAIRPLQYPISRLRDFTRFGGKTSYRLVNRGPGVSWTIDNLVLWLPTHFKYSTSRMLYIYNTYMGLSVLSFIFMYYEFQANSLVYSHASFAFTILVYFWPNKTIMLCMWSVHMLWLIICIAFIIAVKTTMSVGRYQSKFSYVSFINFEFIFRMS